MEVLEYQRRMGHISVEQLAQISRDGNFHLPFSTQVQPHLRSYIKGKNSRIRQGPTALVEAGEPKHSHQSLEVVIGFIAQQAFLFSYSPQMGLLSSPKSRLHLLNHINNFRSQYSVTEIRSDEESGILALRSDHGNQADEELKERHSSSRYSSGSHRHSF
jgi:hypothetical protein